jgi:serine/threonine protein kinase
VWVERVLKRPRRSQILSDWRQDITQFREIKIVGRGRFGDVKLIKNHRTKQDVAIKFLTAAPADTPDYGARIKELFLREVQILLLLGHPCVLTFKGYFLPRSESD